MYVLTSPTAIYSDTYHGNYYCVQCTCVRAHRKELHWQSCNMQDTCICSRELLSFKLFLFRNEGGDPFVPDVNPFYEYDNSTHECVLIMFVLQSPMNRGVIIHLYTCTCTCFKSESHLDITNLAGIPITFKVLSYHCIL